MHPENLDFKPFLDHSSSDNTIVLLNKSDIKLGKPPGIGNFLRLNYLGNNLENLKIIHTSIKEEKNLERQIILYIRALLKKIKDNKSYIVGDRKENTFSLTASLTASALGAYQ